jgi:hypothetical protein
VRPRPASPLPRSNSAKAHASRSASRALRRNSSHGSLEPRMQSPPPERARLRGLCGAGEGGAGRLSLALAQLGVPDRHPLVPRCAQGLLQCGPAPRMRLAVPVPTPYVCARAVCATHERLGRLLPHSELRIPPEVARHALPGDDSVSSRPRPRASSASATVASSEEALAALSAA